LELKRTFKRWIEVVADQICQLIDQQECQRKQDYQQIDQHYLNNQWFKKSGPKEALFRLKGVDQIHQGVLIQLYEFIIIKLW